MSSRDIPVARTSRALSKSDPEEYGLLDDLLEAMAELPREAQRYILGVAQGMAMKAEMQTVS